VTKLNESITLVRGAKRVDIKRPILAKPISLVELKLQAMEVFPEWFFK